MIEDICEQNLAQISHKSCVLMTDDTGLLDITTQFKPTLLLWAWSQTERIAYENFWATYIEPGDAKLALECCLG